MHFLTLSLVLAASSASQLCLVVESTGHLLVLSCAAEKGTRLLLTDPQSSTQSEAEVGASVPCPNVPGLDLHACSAIRFPKGATRPGAPLVGILGSPRLKAVKKDLTVDWGSGTKPVTLRVCASSEGMHFTAWEGLPIKGTRVWHSYFYLGYDTEPDCDDAETAER